MRSLVLLVGGTLVLWAVLLYPGRIWLGDDAILHSAVAWVLCVLPGAAVTAWALRKDLTPEMRVMTILGGSGVRMAATLGGGFVLTELLPETFTKIFWLWVGVFYIVLLTLEVWLLLQQQQNMTSAGSTPPTLPKA